MQHTHFDFPEYDLYETLEISPDAEMADIKSAYNRLVLQYHPDKNTQTQNQEDIDKLKRIIHAYKILSCYKQRRHYDSYRKHRKRNTKLCNNVFMPFSLFDGFDDTFNNFFSDDTFTNFFNENPFNNDFFSNPIHNKLSFAHNNTFKKDATGNVTQQQYVTTNINGKKDTFFYQEVKNKDGKILKKEGSPMPENFIQYNTNKMQHKSIRNK